MADKLETQLASDCPEFVFVEFNPRRKMRGVEAARVQVDDDGGWLWMSKLDLQRNIDDFGPHPELLKAMEHYR
jgi:hypothetical protein